ncbi:hypothetical protein HNR73_003878 [Phytomonospora endophytica]|uniref:DUF1963 domain-containing protein n=2 Tax=Phytomonospora endophytica TaxID=714109 RepID=A0A841FVK8_9ACTN|nr:hypothetical protein [Phytomonospora endophytica]GIG66916.1 hypothetical protein Pen01_32110 [Phytomonospora endophytica]
MGASAGAPEAGQVVYIPDGAGLRRRAPTALTCVEAEPLTGWVDLTQPEYAAAAWRARYGESDPEVLEALDGGGFEPPYGEGEVPTKIGGHTYAMQDPPEDELVRYAVFEGKADEETVQRELPHWRPLLQYVPHDRTALAGGDYWNLYWFVRDDDLAARRFERALMVEQCT